MKHNNLFNLKGKVAIVTGGAGLIGKEIVRALAEFGASVVVGEIDKTKGKNIAGEFRALKLDVIFKHLNITKESSVSGLIDFLNKKYGRIDIWVNNAYPRTQDWGVIFEEISTQSWRKNVDMHLNGYFVCCQKIAEFMKKQRSGSIINFGSTYGIVGPEFSIYKGTKMTVAAPYSAIKGGIINFTRYLASYYGKYNVRVNSLSPGGVFDKQSKAFIDRYIAKTPLKRMARKEDIVGGVIYLASDAARYVTGHNLVVDGGWSAI